MKKTKTFNEGLADFNEMLRGISKFEFVVNEEKRTVTAIMTNTSNNARRCLFRMDNKAAFICGTELNLPNKIVATVHCAEEDEFDAEVGKRLAKKKAYIKFDRMRTKAFYRYREFLEKRIEGVNKAIKKFYSDAVKPEDTK